jgi:LacI family transcriptional regulator, repressor for deo operon, udp, cdd, tsx, nupC, and nupG
MSVRLSDVAQRAGVSTATVSRVLNDKVGVSPVAREAVLAAIDAMGYARPSLLKPRNSNLIGLVVPELENPFFPRIAQAITTSLSQHGATPVLCTHTQGPQQEAQYIESLIELGVAGIIFVSGYHALDGDAHDEYQELHRRYLPFVCINGVTDDIGAPALSTDEVSAAEQAVAHLVALGHERIGLVVGSDRYIPVRRRISGFTKAMQRLTGMKDLLITQTPFTVEGGQAGAERLLAEGVTAIVAGSDMMALGAIRAARMRGLHVPDDLSVVGFDDSLLIGFTDPPLTTIRQQVLAMGQAAVDALLAQVNGQRPERTEYLFEPELVVRGSTGPAPSLKGGRVIPIESGAGRR